MTCGTLFGLLGATVAILAYGLVSSGRIAVERGYAWLTLLAAALIGVSLIEQPNVATAVIQVFFAGIAVHSLVRSKWTPTQTSPRVSARTA